MSFTRAHSCLVSVVQGGGRGLGLAIASHLGIRGLENVSSSAFSKQVVIVTTRNPKEAQQLQNLQEECNSKKEINSQIHIVQLHLDDDKSIAKAAEEIRHISNGHVNALYNVSGVLQPEKRIVEISRESMLEHFTTNTFGNVLFSKAMLPFLLAASEKKKNSDGKHDYNAGNKVKYMSPLPRIVNISARVGSIGDNYLGGWFSYRSSKTALNQYTKTMGIELQRKGIICIAIHPGTVDTQMTAPYRANIKPEKLFSVERAAKQVVNVAGSLSIEDTGNFFDYAGRIIPW